MKHKLIVTALVSLAAIVGLADEATNTAQTAQASSITDGGSGGRFGAGLLLGEPTGVSLKGWLSETLAIDGALGWSFEGETDPHVHSDVLWHMFDVFPVREGRLPLYFGVGARVKFREDRSDRFGIRAPVGVSYIFPDKPVDVFVEVAPVLDFAPSTRLGFMAGVGARYWF